MAGIGFRALVVKAGGSRKTLLPLYYIWRAFPYPLRRLVTALFIMDVHLMKKLFRVERRGYWEGLGLPDRADVGDVW